METADYNIVAGISYCRCNQCRRSCVWEIYYELGMENFIISIKIDPSKDSKITKLVKCYLLKIIGKEINYLNEVNKKIETVKFDVQKQ